MADQRYVLGLAYQSGRDERITKGLDNTRDYFTPDELEMAAWSFLPSGAQVGIFHSDDPALASGHFTVTESYIYRGPDWDVEGTLIKAGDWLVGGICDEPAWALVKSGRVTGFSPQGVAKRRKSTVRSTP